MNLNVSQGLVAMASECHLERLSEGWKTGFPNGSFTWLASWSVGCWLGAQWESWAGTSVSLYQNIPWAS